MKNLIAVFFLFGCFYGHAQIRLSVGGDLSLMRNFSPGQKFWSLGETVQFNFHFNQKQSAYAWITYYTPGKFKNNFVAVAKSPGTSPSYHLKLQKDGEIMKYRLDGSTISKEALVRKRVTIYIALQDLD